MGALEDYISGLENVENPNLTEVVSELLKLHNEELGTREAKISQLNDSIAERDTSINSLNEEVKTWKAKNFDLTLQIPGDTERQTVSPINGETDPGTISIDDLFVDPFSKDK